MINHENKNWRSNTYLQAMQIFTYSLNTYKCHKSNIKNLLMKSSDIVFIVFTSILTDYMAHGTEDGSTEALLQILYGQYLILGVFGSYMF